jgi:transcriptional regulator with GAF, ATPase, and Fis domain
LRQAGRAASTSFEEVKRAHILAVLESSGWKVKGRGTATKHLGLKESTLRARMKKLGTRWPSS